MALCTIYILITSSLHPLSAAIAELLTISSHHHCTDQTHVCLCLGNTGRQHRVFLSFHFFFFFFFFGNLWHISLTSRRASRPVTRAMWSRGVAAPVHICQAVATSLVALRSPYATRQILHKVGWSITVICQPSVSIFLSSCVFQNSIYYPRYSCNILSFLSDLLPVICLLIACQKNVNYLP